MVKLRTIVILAGACGLCVLFVVLASLVAAGRPGSEDLHAVTRSLLTADYSADYSADRQRPSSALSPIQPDIIQSIAKDEESLAQTELRITPLSQGGASSWPLLASFGTRPSKAPVPLPTTSTGTSTGKPGPNTSPAPQPAAASSPARPPAASPQSSYTQLRLIPCSQQYLWRSVNSLVETSILFSNRTSLDMKIHRLNLYGSPEFQGDLPAGEQLLVDTYVTNPWLVTDAGGNCRGVYSPRPQPGIVVIE